MEKAHPIIEDLNWRYATKKFDPEKKISEADLEVIKEALRLAPTSYGLQTLKFVIVKSPALREQLIPATYGQRQVADASHLIVLCAYKTVTDQHIDAYMQLVSETREIPITDIQTYGDFLKRTIGAMDQEAMNTWTHKQLYIALGQLLHTCSRLRIDAIPMEGFDAQKYDELLALSTRNLTPVLLCPIGYRDEKDVTQYQPKVRKAREDLFEEI